jgi:hypothetical protein
MIPSKLIGVFGLIMLPLTLMSATLVFIVLGCAVVYIIDRHFNISVMVPARGLRLA